jgi:hypothetical protein
MKSKRILLSEKFYHTIDLSEQSMGVIVHALTVLGQAFSLEPEYHQVIDDAGKAINRAFASEAKEFDV